MGVHRGWFVKWVADGWKASAWDPSTKGYESRRRDPATGYPWTDKGAGADWAKTKSAELRAAFDGCPVERKPASVMLKAAYIADLRRRGLVERHVDEVERRLGLFAADVPDLTAPQARAKTLASIARHCSHLAPSTRNGWLVTLKGFSSWCRRLERIRRDPLATIEPEAVENRLKPQFTLDELRTMARAVDDPYHRRFCLQLYAGLRSQEAHHLEGGRVDFGGGNLFVRLGDYDLKGAKERIVPLQYELALTLGPALPPGPIFSEAIRKRDRQQQRRDLDAFCRRLGFHMGDRSPHSLRHGYAALMTASGVPSILVAANMGHVSQATTAGYSRLAQVHVRSVEGWRRGEFELLTGWVSGWPRA